MRGAIHTSVLGVIEYNNDDYSTDVSGWPSTRVVDTGMYTRVCCTTLPTNVEIEFRNKYGLMVDFQSIPFIVLHFRRRVYL